MKNKSILLIVFLAMTLLLGLVFAEGPKQPSASGVFYPDERVRLSAMVDNLILSVPIQKQNGEIIALILPHAGYGFSGETAAFGYKLIIGSRYNTVVVIGTGHRYGFNGVSVYNKGSFLTPLGSIKVDEDFSGKLLSSDDDIIFEPRAFSEEHSVEVQLPFLQRALKDFKIVPVIMGDCSLSTCKKFANLLKEAIGGREDVLIIVSTDLYHGYDFNEASKIDKLTISFIENMDA